MSHLIFNLNLVDWIILSMIGFSVILSIVKNGQPQEKYNGFATFCASIIVLILYYFAGLFS